MFGSSFSNALKQLKCGMSTLLRSHDRTYGSSPLMPHEPLQEQVWGHSHRSESPKSYDPKQGPGLPQDLSFQSAVPVQGYVNTQVHTEKWK